MRLRSLVSLYHPAILMVIQQRGFEPEQRFEVFRKMSGIVKVGGSGGLRQVHLLVNKLTVV